MRKDNIYVFGKIKKPTSYVVDRIRRRVSLMLKKDFNFYSIDNGLLPRKTQLFHSKPWNSALWSYRAFKCRNPQMKHAVTFYGLTDDIELQKNLQNPLIL